VLKIQFQYHYTETILFNTIGGLLTFYQVLGWVLWTNGTGKQEIS